MSFSDRASGRSVQGADDLRPDGSPPRDRRVSYHPQARRGDRIDIAARLYLREAVGKLGVAPLTSMFLFGENQSRPGDDYRPEVHDADGSSVHAGAGEWIWRPLVNPKRLLMTSFATVNPVGFGRMHAPCRSAGLREPRAALRQRPSVWVEPRAVGRWTGGTGADPVAGRDQRQHRGLLGAGEAAAAQAAARPRVPGGVAEGRRCAPAGWPGSSRRARGTATEKAPENSVGLVIDFDGPVFKKLPADARLEGVVSGDANVEILRRHTYRNDVTGGWRMTLAVRRVDPPANPPSCALFCATAPKRYPRHGVTFCLPTEMNTMRKNLHSSPTAESGSTVAGAPALPERRAAKPAADQHAAAEPYQHGAAPVDVPQGGRGPTTMRVRVMRAAIGTPSARSVAPCLPR